MKGSWQTDWKFVLRRHRNVTICPVCVPSLSFTWGCSANCRLRHLSGGWQWRRVSACITWLNLNAAFDTADHSVLLQRLHTSHIDVIVLDWLADYLEGRAKSVSVLDASVHLYVRFHMVCHKALFFCLFCSFYILISFLVLFLRLALDISFTLITLTSIFM